MTVDLDVKVASVLKQIHESMISEILTSVFLTIQVFWNVTVCHWVSKE